MLRADPRCPPARAGAREIAGGLESGIYVNSTCIKEDIALSLFVWFG